MRTVCDFCGGREQRWRYPIKPNEARVIDGFPAFSEQVGFDACEECSYLIESGGWSMLVEQTLGKILNTLIDVDALRDHIAGIYREFQTQRTGSRTEISAAEIAETPIRLPDFIGSLPGSAVQ